MILGACGESAALTRCWCPPAIFNTFPNAHRQFFHLGKLSVWFGSNWHLTVKCVYSFRWFCFDGGILMVVNYGLGTLLFCCWYLRLFFMVSPKDPVNRYKENMLHKWGVMNPRGEFENIGKFRVQKSVTYDTYFLFNNKYF